MKLPPLTYRSDVDGLRAVAVLAVILFHIDPTWMPGGFVGVDVFFVISGYLITGLILSQLGEGRFSILTFFSRRVRRILPAAFVVGGATLVVGRVILFGPDLVELVESGVAQLAFAANFYFYFHLDYFNGHTEMKPLIHMWSLAVEEQFYFVYPLFLVFVVRCGKSTRTLAAACVLVWIASLACSEILVRRDAPAAFYLLPSRAWELLTGALIWSLPSIAWWPRRARTALSGVGLLILLGALVSFNGWMAFPGVVALFPCLSTAAVIYVESVDRTPVGRLLASGALAWVGKLSYSLYLWHWPVLAYLRHLTNPHITLPWAAVAIAVTVVLSVLTYFAVEQPLRAPRRSAAGDDSLSDVGVVARDKADDARDYRSGWSSATKRAVAAIVGLVAAYICALGFAQREVAAQGWIVQQAAGRKAIALRYMAAHDDCDDYPAVSLGAVLNRTIVPCVEGSSGTRVVVWGDSHAMAIMPALVPWAISNNIQLEQLADGGVPPLLDAPPAPNEGRSMSATLSEATFHYLAETQPDAVVLCGYWAKYIERDADRVDRQIRMTADALVRAGLQSYWMCDVAQFSRGVPHELARRVRAGEAVGTVLMPAAKYERDNGVALSAFAAFDSPLLRVLDPAPYLTNAGGDWFGNDGDAIYYRDRDHLTKTGAELLQPLFEPVFSELVEPSPTEPRR